MPGEFPKGAHGDRKMIATQQEMHDEQVPLKNRDLCAHLLIPLNRCRKETKWFPNACHDLKHSYEICEYKLWKERVAHKRKIDMQLLEAKLAAK